MNEGTNTKSTDSINTNRGDKWLLVDFHPDLPGNAAVSLPLAIADTSAAIA